MNIDTLVHRFAQALKWIDDSRVPYKGYHPGVGSYAEPQVVKKALEFLKSRFQPDFEHARTSRQPDIIIPRKWAIEVKMVRPYRNNGQPAEHWSENLLHPYEGNVSALGDALKLLNSGLDENKAILVFAYEDVPPRIDLKPLFSSFEQLARQVLKINLGPRHTAGAGNLVHPVHRQLTVYGWEVAP